MEVTEKAVGNFADHLKCNAVHGLVDPLELCHLYAAYVKCQVHPAVPETMSASTPTTQQLSHCHCRSHTGILHLSPSRIALLAWPFLLLPCLSLSAFVQPVSVLPVSSTPSLCTVTLHCHSAPPFYSSAASQRALPMCSSPPRRCSVRSWSPKA